MIPNIIDYKVPFKPSEDIEKIRLALTKHHYQQIPIKTAEEISQLKYAGGICADILDEISPFVKPGATKKPLNDVIRDTISLI